LQASQSALRAPVLSSETQLSSFHLRALKRRSSS
jgi:hypothetical protein